MRSKVFSIILASILLGALVQYMPRASALYENDTLNNIIPTDFPLRTNSGLLNFSPGEITYNPDAVKVMIKGRGSIEGISDRVHVSHQIKTKDGGYIAFATTTSANLPLLKAQGLDVKSDTRLEFDEVRDASRFGEILGSSAVIKDQGFTGRGVKVAIVDTGTDFANKDLVNAVARNANREPIMLDADGQGIVLTKTKFKANITPRGNLLNNTLPKDADPFTGNVYYNDKGVFLNLNRGANGTKFEVYNSIYPLISPLILNATSNKDWKIGENNQNFIRSMSGEYRMGFVLQIQFHLGRAGLIIIPVLLVDSTKAGVYDMVIADMSSSWADFSKFELRKPDVKFDYSFIDEKKIKLGSENELLTYDADKDGNIDLTAGMVGANVLDVWGAIKNNTKSKISDYMGAVNGTLLKPIDPDGNYFGVMFDFLGHGTGSAASIASQGKDVYDVYKNSTKYRLKGIAPDAKIIPVKALWYGDAVYGWLWASGFEQDEKENWKYVARHRADIINNSWGVSTFPVLDYGPGYDLLSLLSSMLGVPGAIDPIFPGVLMVTSAGNTGFGYGTVGPPGNSPFALTVGATTNNVFVGSAFTKNEPRFGNNTAYYDDVAGFSSRGPGIFGDSKPEVMSIGAYGFVSMPPNTKYAVNATGAFGVFGGTSMAAPLAAGAAALVIEALKNEGMEVNPFIVKSVLMSTAKDLGSDPFTQGSGRVDVSSAVDYIKGKNGKFLVYTNDTYPMITNLLNKTISSYDLKGFGNYTLGFPEKAMPDTKWYAGYLNIGESKESTFSVVNRADRAFTVNIKPTMLELIKQQSINGTTEVRKKDPVLNGNSTGYAPNYINLNEKMKIPPDAEVMIVKAYFPFESFLNSTDTLYADSLRISSLYFYDWDDKNTDKQVSFDELSMINRGGAWGTVQEVTIHDPVNRVKHTPLIGIYPVPTIYSYWNGNTKQNSTSMNYTLSVSFYKKSEWDAISVDTDSLDLSPHSQRTFHARVTVPDDTMPGIYQGFITVKSRAQTTNIPVSFAVPVTVKTKDVPVVVSGKPRSDLLYDNASITGSFDMLSRYNAGDWKVYHFNITDATVNAMNMKVTWRNNWTSVNALVVDPEGKIVATSVPAGVFKVFLEWASNDWLGSTRFSDGGGFYPAANQGTNSTVLYVPVNSTGIYSLMLHTTLFHGKELIEPIRIEAKFTTLLPDTEPPKISVNLPEYVRGTVQIPLEIDEENPADITYTLDGSDPISVGKNTTITLDTEQIVEGFHRLGIVASDTVGHRVFKDLAFVVDNTKPDLKVKSPEDGSVVSGKFDVGLEVSDSTLKGFSVALPNGTRIDNNKNFTVDTTDLADGDYQLQVHAEDGAANVADKTVALKIDKTNPVVSISSPSEGETLSGAVSVKYDVKEENLKSVVLSMGGKSVEIGDKGSYPFDTNTIFDGKHVMEVVVTDKAGNVSTASVNVATSNFESSLVTAQIIGIMIGLAIGGGVTTAILLSKYRKGRGMSSSEMQYDQESGS